MDPDLPALSDPWIDEVIESLKWLSSIVFLLVGVNVVMFVVFVLGVLVLEGR